jgi:hypothetical protein
MDTLLNKLDVPFTFRQQPAPLPGDLRLVWRICLLLLILRYSRAGKASLQKLHVLNWATRTDANQTLLLQFVEGAAGKDQIVPRVEPSLNRAINFALGEGLVTVQSGRNLRLTVKGRMAAEEIDADVELLTSERAFLQRIRSFATERNIEDLLTWRLTV